MNQLSTFIKKTFLLMIVLSLLGCGASHSKKLSPHTLSLETETADPFIFKNNKTSYYLFSTNANKINVPVYTSSDMKTWKLLGDAFPNMSTWARKGFTWAPEVMESNGRYLLYYTARHKPSNQLRIEKTQCIGVAIALKIEGPYIDNSSKPLVCDFEQGGSIDASPYRDDNGKLYLLWKNSGTKVGLPTEIHIAPLNSSGTEIVGNSTKLIENDQNWEGRHVEAPTLIKRNNKYYLFYSAGAGTTYQYAVGYATSDNLTGPYKKYMDNPILKGGGQLSAPGHQGIFRDENGDYHMVFHNTNRKAKSRDATIERIKWNREQPEIENAP
jgi:beta-xylosidase